VFHDGEKIMRKPMRDRKETARRLWVLQVLSCALLTNAAAQGLDTTDYFPLNVGDKYSYSNSLPCPPDTVQVRYYPFEDRFTTDSVWIEGKKYFVIDRFFLSPDTLRIDELGNVVIRNWGEDKTFFKFNAAVGDTWSFTLRNRQVGPWVYVATLVSRADSVLVHAGRFGRCLRFRICPSVECVDFWLAPKVGLVFYCAQEPLELYEAQVKGVRYPVITSVEERKISPITESVLHQNYPNPFNPQTTITYESRTSGYAVLKITDILGRKIRTLVDGFVQAGPHEIMWNGKNADGESVVSGIYIYTLSVNEFHGSRKLLFIK